MTTPDLRETVARAIAGAHMHLGGPWTGGIEGSSDDWRMADAAIAATIDWLAERADAEGLALVERQAIPGSYLVHEGGDVSAWIRAQAPEGVRE